MTGHIVHHAANGLMWPLPPAGSMPKKQPIAWSASEPYKGLGFRNVLSQSKLDKYQLSEYPIKENVILS